MRFAYLSQCSISRAARCYIRRTIGISLTNALQGGSRGHDHDIRTPSSVERPQSQSSQAATA